MQILFLNLRKLKVHEINIYWNVLTHILPPQMLTFNIVLCKAVHGSYAYMS